MKKCCLWNCNKPYCINLATSRRWTRCTIMASRLIVWDWRRKLNKDLIDQTLKRLPPWLWLKYNRPSLIIKCTRAKLLTNVWNDISDNLYHNERHRDPKMRNLSNKKIGLQNIPNWAGSVSFKRFDTQLSKDSIRVKLKKCFKLWNLN